MDGEPQDRLNDFSLPIERARGERLDPSRQRWLVVPGDSVPTQDSESTHDSDNAGGVALNDGGARDVGEYYEIPFGAGWPVEE
jgi:hypothetical protein